MTINSQQEHKQTIQQQEQQTVTMQNKNTTQK